MRKLIKWCNDWWLTVAALFLAAFIPLYPKLPLLDVRNTWVYVRVEDFVVLFVIASWVILFFRNSWKLNAPLTVPIVLFWLIGGVATLHSVLFIAPSVWDIFPNLSFLSFLRRIEYMSLFFVAYYSVKDKRFITPLIVTLVATVFAVSAYGIGQKYVGLPAFLTMNEEFAKGVPIQLSALSRVSSTFGGHYDLAAFLALTVPILVSLMFGFTRWWVRITLGFVSLLGVFVLFMTVSRISFFALFISLGIVLFFQQRRFVLMILPVIAIGVMLIVGYSPRLLDRFGSTVREIDVLVDTKTGNPIGHVKEVPNTYFADKTVWQRFYDSVGDVSANSSPSASLIVDYTLLPGSVTLLTEPTAPTGEDLPSGTGYINLTLSPDVRRLGNFMFEPKQASATTSAEVFIINGEYLIKRALAYDLSFTTRFQGEWPNALNAFRRNIFLGSGYGSASLAVDNSYLRMLAEVGILGFVSFLAIFLMMGIYIQRTLTNIDSPVTKSFVLGFSAGVVGMIVNALFIDVFEASKVAFTLWLLTGAVFGILRFYQRSVIHFFPEIRKAITSSYAIVLYLLLAVVVLFSSMTKNYFVGDDFTWFRWAAECVNTLHASGGCATSASAIARYFTHSEGFFYRPGTKLYFSLMYRAFWLNQTAYHLVSVFLHFVVSVLVYFLAMKIFKRKILAALSALLFVGLSGYAEAVFWISASGFLFTTCFMLTSLLLFDIWRAKKQMVYFVATFCSLLFALMFHELGIVTPVLIVLYEWFITDDPAQLRNKLRNATTLVLLLPIPLYMVIRLIANSHWLSGDYSYNLYKFPLNAVGNALGYVLITLVGPFGLLPYQLLRSVMRSHAFIAITVVVLGVVLALPIVRKAFVAMEQAKQKILVFSLCFVVIALLPFLGLGNITSRYSYLASIGVVFVVVFYIDALYAYLMKSGRDIAIYGTTMIISVFVLFQSVGLYQVHKDWNEAGEIVRTFFVTIDSSYHDYWTTTPMEFHFVNVPIRHNDAWVFPVGISDALWFILRNPNIRVYTESSEQSAFNAVTSGSTTQKIFVFDASGHVKEVKKPDSSTQ